MKQKNLLLVGVAVVCGLIAAFLTTRMNANPSQRQEETVEVLVAVKDLPIGTKLDKAEFDKLVTTKQMPVSAVPKAYVESKELLLDKWLINGVRADHTFNPSDIKDHPMQLQPPPGFGVMTFKASKDEAVEFFVKPGHKVDVIAAVKMLKSNKSLVFPLFQDMLVLATGTTSQQTHENNGPVQADSVSVAVTHDQAVLLEAAIARNSQFRLLLRHPEHPGKYTYTPTVEEISKILSGEIEDEQENKENQAPPPPPKIETVMVKVLKKDLPAGTEITEDFLKEFVEEKEQLASNLSETAIRDFRPYLGRFLTKDLAAGQFVPQHFIGEKPKPQELPWNKVKPGPGGFAIAPKSVGEVPEPKAGEQPFVGPPPPPEEKPKREFVDVRVESPSGIIYYRYEKFPSGRTMLRGTLTEAQYQSLVAPGEESPQEASPKTENQPNKDQKPRRLTGL